MIGQESKIQWTPLFGSREYPLFIIDLAGQAYVTIMEQEIGWGYSDQLFISEQGKVTVYYSQSDADSFKKFCAEQPPEWFYSIFQKINLRSLELQAAAQQFVNLYLSDIIGALTIIHKAYQNRYGVYRFISMIDISFGESNFLPQEVFITGGNTKDFTGKVCDAVDAEVLPLLTATLVNRFGFDPKLVLYLTFKEMMDGLSGKKIIDKNELKRRHDFYIYSIVNHKIIFSPGSVARDKLSFYNIAPAAIPDTFIKGKTAFKGITTGRVVVVLTSDDFHKIVPNVILVAPMTTVRYYPYLKQVSGIITDEGGITCHAAIIARELEKPCVVDTKIATKVLKDSYMVEVNANHGVVKILERE